MSTALAKIWNRECHCIGLEVDELRKSLQQQSINSPLHDNLYADYPVFIGEEDVKRMQAVIGAIENLAKESAYQSWMAQHVPLKLPEHERTHGVFSSYDFHLTDHGPKLIEVNTNAGGAILGAHLAASQRFNRGCCAIETPNLADISTRWMGMFQTEWRAQRGSKKLRSIAIVDDNPSEQFLYQEFELAQKMFELHGLRAYICGPEALQHSDGKLFANGVAIDLVYNRLTDFYFQEDTSHALLAAYSSNDVVLTPSPKHHSLLANKRSLSYWSNQELLAQSSLSEAERNSLIDAVPHTRTVSPENTETLWAERKQLFFKPLDGYASRGAYAGAKLTKTKWQEILKGNYIAQQLVKPSLRNIPVKGEMRSLKVDLRCLSYQGEIQQVSARLYQGQTTNMRTDGGGLAAVIEL
mgnify:CR=1 FL=1